jgi:diacylglycerol diphosphate phosphatase/phosphatidate phosphatase
MSHKPHPPRVRREEELPTVNPATDHHSLSYTDGVEGEEVELVDSGVRKPDPALTGRQGEYRIDGGAPRL